MTGPDRAFRHTAWHRWPLRRSGSRTRSWISFGFLSTNIANKRESTRPNSYKKKVFSRSGFRRRERRAREPPHKRRSARPSRIRHKGSDPPQVRPFPKGSDRGGRAVSRSSAPSVGRLPKSRPNPPRDAPEKARQHPRNAAPAMRRKKLGNAPGMPPPRCAGKGSATPPKCRPPPRPGYPRIKNDAVFSNSAPECTPAGTSTGSYRFLTGSECSLRPQKCNFG